MTYNKPMTLDEIDLSVLKEVCKNEEFWLKTLERIKVKNSTEVIKKDHTELELQLGTFIFQRDYINLVEDIFNSTYTWSVPEKVLLSKAGTTKKRTVYLYSEFDRFVLGSLYRGMNEYFSNLFYPNCFSYRPKVTTYSAISYISEMKQNKGLYGLKMDISAYFNSINREHLTNCMTELFGVDTGLRGSFDKVFLDDTITYKGTEMQEYKSLIPGSAMGSFFANYCLRELDKYFHENNIIYARYSDDIIILAETPEIINEHLAYIHKHLDMYGLTINPKKYAHFEPHEPVDYLGLTLSDKGVDISKHTKDKLKKTIKRWVKKARRDVEMGETTFEKIAPRIISRFNYKVYKSYVEDETRFGWAYYVFRFVDQLDSLIDIDHYLRDQIRYLKTGKHNKANINKVTDEDFLKLGVLSLVDMYFLFKTDLDYYKETISVLKVHSSWYTDDLDDM